MSQSSLCIPTHGHKPPATLSLPALYEHIRTGTWAEPVAAVRAARRALDAAPNAAVQTCEATWRDAKSALPAVTLSCAGSTRAKAVPLDQRDIVATERLQVDIDLHGQDHYERESIRKYLLGSPYLEAIFVSPSGDGWKGVLRVAGAGDPTTHHHAVAATEAHLQALIGQGNDPAVKDVQRLCYVSHDPNLVYRAAADVLQPTDMSATPFGTFGTASAGITDAQTGANDPFGTFVTASPGVTDAQTGSDDPFGTFVTASPASPACDTTSQTIPQGRRNQTLFRIGCGLRGRGLERSAITATLQTENRTRCTPPLTDGELTGLIESVLGYDTPHAQALDAFTTHPQPIAPPDLPVPACDPSLLPEAVRAYIVDVSERMQAPLDFAAVALMVVVGSVIGNRLCIRPKHYDDWTVVPNLWGAVVGRPSAMKSPALAEPLGFLHALEDRERQHYEATHRAWRQRAQARDVIEKQSLALASKKARQLMDKQQDATEAVTSLY